MPRQRHEPGSVGFKVVLLVSFAFLVSGVGDATCLRFVVVFDVEDAAQWRAQSNGTMTMTRPDVRIVSRPAGVRRAYSSLHEVTFPRPHIPMVVGAFGQLAQSNYGKALDAMNNSVITLEMEGVFVRADNVMLEGNSYVMLDPGCHQPCKTWIKEIVESVTYGYSVYRSVVCVGHMYSATYAHWLLEIWPCLASLDQYILRRSVVLLPQRTRFNVEGLKFLGVSESQIVTGFDTVVFAERFYTIDAVTCHKVSAVLITNLRNSLVRRFALDRETPTLFVTYNRERGKNRRIRNYKELRNRLESEWPSITWQNCRLVGSLCERAVYFNKVKVFFAGHGSVMANTLFMQADTAIIELQGRSHGSTIFQWLCAYTGKHQTIGWDASISFLGRAANTINIDAAVELVSAGLRSIGA